MIYLANSLSVTMQAYPVIGVNHPLDIVRISAMEAGETLRKNRFRSVYGHRNTACHLAKYLHIFVPVRRESILLERGDVLIIAKANRDQDYRGGLRKAPKWQFFRVTVGAEPPAEG